MATGGSSEGTLRDLLECAICLHPMRDPRCLPCQHSFCFFCLESLQNKNPSQRVNCPSCRLTIQYKVQDLPCDFKLNTVSQFMDTCSKEEAEEVTCSFCSEEAVKREVTMFCKGCDDYLCAPCAGAHKETVMFTNHEIICIPERGSVARHCSQHTRKRKNYYCMDCDVSTCVSCVMMKHKKHHIQDVLSYVGTSKQEIVNLSSLLETSLLLESPLMNGQVDLLICGFDERLSEIQEQVKASAIDKMISLVHDYKTLSESLKHDEQAFRKAVGEISEGDSTKMTVQFLRENCADYLKSECPSKADHDKLCSDIRAAKAKCDRLTEGLSSLSSIHIPLSFSSDISQVPVGIIKRSESSMADLDLEQLRSIQNERHQPLPTHRASVGSLSADGAGLVADDTTTGLLTQLLNHVTQSNVITKSGRPLGFKKPLCRPRNVTASIRGGSRRGMATRGMATIGNFSQARD